jgi:hypothetical protein
MPPAARPVADRPKPKRVVDPDGTLPLLID